MAVDISEYLDIIAGDSEGEEVIQAIHDASLALGLDMYKTADIADLLEDIKTRVFGREIRMDIHEILKRLSEAEPESGVASSVHGSISTITNVHGSFANGALYGNTSYRMVEYLKSTGTQYIVTDIVPTYSTRTELDCKFDVTNYDNVHVVFFGIQIGGNLGADSKWYFTSLEKGSGSSRRNCGFFIGFTWYSGISSSYLITDVPYNNRNVVVCNHPQSAYGSNSTTITEQVTLQQPNVGVAFFGVTGRSGISGNAFNVGNMYLYGAKMYDDGNLSHRLIPVERVQDNELGLLDVMTGEFYTNTGTGTFAKGGYV